MSAERDIERTLESWLADGINRMPDRVYRTVVERVDRQPQRHGWRLQPWKLPRTNRQLRIVLVGAAIVATAAAGSILIAGDPNALVVSPSPTPRLTATVPPRATTVHPNLPDGRLDPGIYTAHPIPGDAMTWVIEVPDGWTGDQNWSVQSDAAPGGTGVYVGGPSQHQSIPTDSCAAVGTKPAESVDEFIAALQARDVRDWAVSLPVEVTVSGYPGVRIDLRVPAKATCPNGNDYMVLSYPDGTGFKALGPWNQFRIWVIDVEGTPTVLFRNSFDESPADRVAQGDEIVTTGVITP